MSNLIPPLLSSSPPPIVGPLDEDDDDEFGDFRAATNSYDCDDFSPPPSPRKSPEKVIVKNDEKPTVLDINSNNNDEKSIINKTEINEAFLNCEGNQKDFQDKRKINENDLKSDDQVNTCNSLSDDNSSTFHEDCDGNKIDNSDDNGPNIDDINTETCDSSKSDELESIESDKIDGNTTIDNSDDFETHFVEKDPTHSDLSIPSDNCNNSQMMETKIDDKLDDDDFTDFQTIECKIDDNDNSTNSQTIETEIKSNQIENDDDEFSDFPIIERELKDNQSDNDNFANFPTIQTEIGEHQIDNNFADFQSNQDDDFGDFEEPPPPLQQIQPTETVNRSNDDDDDDFDDFSAFTSNQPILLLDSNEVLNKCEIIVKEIFPEIEKNDDIDEFRYINETENDQVFNLLKDVTETNALKYQWSKSSSQKTLLKSLNIDMRNILYGPGWNSCMPRFASNLGVTPLEPIKPEILTPTPVQQQHQQQQQQSSPSIDSSQKEQINNVDIPNAQFDWNDSGLINPLDSAPSKKEQTKQHLEEPNPSQEKSDLFLASITEKIKNLTSTPTTIENNQLKDLESPKMIPLRETHISNDNINLEKPDWFQSTVQTPDLPRKTEFINVDNDADDFDDFQMVLPENEAVTTASVTDPDLRIFDNLNRQPVEEVITIQNSNNNKTIDNANDNDDEFTDFHSSLPTVLQPTPLQPLKPSIVNPLSSTSTQINWPEPGVSDEEIRNIELSYSRNKIEENKSNQLMSVAQHQSNRCEEDEWSDFVSVIPTPKPVTTIERTATPDLPLSVLNLNYIQPAKPPIPVITPNGLVQTKLSTDNAPKSTNIVQRKISTNYQQPTLITNQFNNLQSANFDLITTPIKPTPIQTNFNQIINPITQSGNNNENIDDDDEDWSDFVSSQPPTVNGYQMKINQNKTNITTNPNFDTFQNYTNPVRKNSFINGQPKSNSGLSNIATIPDLDFIAPKSRNKK